MENAFQALKLLPPPLPFIPTFLYLQRGWGTQSCHCFSTPSLVKQRPTPRFGVWYLLHCDALAETAIRTCDSVLLRGLSWGCSQSAAKMGSPLKAWLGKDPLSSPCGGWYNSVSRGTLARGLSQFLAMWAPPTWLPVLLSVQTEETIERVCIKTEVTQMWHRGTEHDDGKGYECTRTGIDGKSLYLLFNSAVNLKLLLNKGYLKNRSYDFMTPHYHCCSTS